MNSSSQALSMSPWCWMVSLEGTKTPKHWEFTLSGLAIGTMRLLLLTYRGASYACDQGTTCQKQISSDGILREHLISEQPLIWRWNPRTNSLLPTIRNLLKYMHTSTLWITEFGSTMSVTKIYNISTSLPFIYSGSFPKCLATSHDQCSMYPFLPPCWTVLTGMGYDWRRRRR